MRVFFFPEQPGAAQQSFSPIIFPWKKSIFWDSSLKAPKMRKSQKKIGVNLYRKHASKGIYLTKDQ